MPCTRIEHHLTGCGHLSPGQRVSFFWLALGALGVAPQGAHEWQITHHAQYSVRSMRKGRGDGCGSENSRATQFCVARLPVDRSQGPRVHPRPRPRCPMHLVSETINIWVGRNHWGLPKPHWQVEVLDAHGRWLGVAKLPTHVDPSPTAYRKWPRRWRAGPFTRLITPQPCTPVPTACITCALEACWGSVVKPQAPLRGTASRCVHSLDQAGLSTPNRFPQINSINGAPGVMLSAMRHRKWLLVRPPSAALALRCMTVSVTIILDGVDAPGGCTFGGGHVPVHPVKCQS
jgi:hypothetical protein